jgi:hypothetical protein
MKSQNIRINCDDNRLLKKQIRKYKYDTHYDDVYSMDYLKSLYDELKNIDLKLNIEETFCDLFSIVETPSLFTPGMFAMNYNMNCYFRKESEHICKK